MTKPEIRVHDASAIMLHASLLLAATVLSE